MSEDRRIFVTSDTHFGHNKEFVFAVRGFDSIEKMNEELVYRWNQMVRPEDVVYHLGDVYMEDEANCNLVGRLNGHIQLIRGNHDTDNKIATLLEKGYIESACWADVLHYQHKHFYMGHYPMMTGNATDIKNSLRGRTLDLYGHTHQNTNFWNDIPFVYHVGVDSHVFAPVLLDDIIQDMRRKLDINGRERL